MDMIFCDREHAGRVLAGLLQGLAGKDRAVVAIPNGGIPVGIRIAGALDAELGVEVVRKLQVPGNSEAGFGAVTSKGDVIQNDMLVRHLGLDPGTVRNVADKTLGEIRRRQKELGAPKLRLHGRTVIIVDDGLASGFTMLAAIGSVRREGPAAVVVAVPTASLGSVEMVGAAADRVVCPNIRAGHPFAVADAYEDWYDLSTGEASALLQDWLGKRRKADAGRPIITNSSK